LFKGLYIDSSDWKWEPYPVLYLDLNTDKFAEPGILDGVLDNLFNEWEARYDIQEKAENLSTRFRNIIKAAHEKTGRQVVILVDEYDKPLTGNLRKSDNFEHYRTKLASVYSNLKSSAEHIRLAFLTGISRFSKLSVFSDLNNLNDISFDDAFADICGITEKELMDLFHIGIENLANQYQMSYEDMCLRLKKNYDGYRFSKRGSEIYNPWSVLNAMYKKDIRNYWIGTGTSSVVAEALRDAHVNVEETLNAEWDIDDLAGLDLLNADPTALLYQTGYLTIGHYDMETEMVHVKVPNEEVRKGLFSGLLNVYLNPERGTVKSIVDGLMKALRKGDPEEMMRSLDAFFAGIPYDLKMDNENNFHNAFYILTTLLGIDTEAEIHTSDGRIDLLIQTTKFIYIIELKYDATPEEALRQIDEKDYTRKFSTDTRTLFKIGVSFSSKTRRIEAWKIEQ
ncbi:MAG: AAA family ATPase, partial [Bacteroides sp.]|nr:AAA family ATPase [Bacteroides sp.]